MSAFFVNNMNFVTSANVIEVMRQLNLKYEFVFFGENIDFVTSAHVIVQCSRSCSANEISSTNWLHVKQTCEIARMDD